MGGPTDGVKGMLGVAGIPIKFKSLPAALQNELFKANASSPTMNPENLKLFTTSSQKQNIDKDEVVLTFSYLRNRYTLLISGSSNCATLTAKDVISAENKQLACIPLDDVNAWGILTAARSELKAPAGVDATAVDKARATILKGNHCSATQTIEHPDLVDCALQTMMDDARFNRHNSRDTPQLF